MCELLPLRIVLGTSFCLFLGHVFQLFRIVDGRRDHIPAAGPLAQINQAAAVAAKREVLIFPQHQGAASGTTQCGSFLPWHKCLDEPALADDARNQVIVMRLSNLAAIKSAGHKLFMAAKVVDEKLAVNLRGVHFRAAFP